MEIEIIAKYDALTERAMEHLSVVGKRARRVTGESMYSDIVPSDNEVPIFKNLIDNGAETLVASLPDICSSYAPVFAVAVDEDSDGGDDADDDAGISVESDIDSADNGSVDDEDVVYTDEKIGVKFSILSNRWTDDSNSPNMDLTKALEDAVYSYLFNFALSMYLSDIHPGTGAKYPPLWGQAYKEATAVILNNIRSLALTKRRKGSSHSYADITATTSNT